MISISKCARSQIQYYTEEVAARDYYSEGHRAHGRWMGAGARRLGLTGPVGPVQFAALWAGYSPDGHPLVQHQAGREHQPAWDVSFSPPKSVSDLWSLLPPAERARAEDAHQRAIDAAVQYLQDEAIVCRRGKGGAHRERVDLVVAAFRHVDNRNHEPQLHDHLLFINVGVRPDGTTGTIESQPIYEHQRQATKVYRAKLSSILQNELNLRVALLPDGAFRLADVPQSLEDATSSRRKEVLEYLAKTDTPYSSAAARDAALRTRTRKEYVPVNALFTAWADVGRQHALGPEQAMALLRGPALLRRDDPSHRPEGRGVYTPVDLDALIMGKARELAGEFGAFQRRRLVEVVMDEAQERGLDPEPLLRRIKDHAKPYGKLRYADPDGTWLRTAHKAASLARIERHAEALSANGSHYLRESWVMAAARGATGLSDEQRRALMNVVCRHGAIEVVDGLAGSGQEQVLRTAREVWEKAGYRVVGAAPQADAARDLERTTGIQTRTATRLAIDLYDSAGYRIRHYGQQIARAARGRRTFGPDVDRLSPKTVLVIADAERLGKFEADFLLERAAEAGAKVVMVGDRMQLDPARASAYGYLADLYAATRLTTVRRTLEAWMGEAVLQAAAGDVYGAYTQYALAGRLTIHKTKAETMRALVWRWGAQKTRGVKGTLIIADRDDDVRQLNALAQAERQRRGEVGTVLKQRLHGSWVYVNDRVRLNGGNRAKGYVSGDQGTVESIGLDAVTIRLDRTEGTLVGPRHVKVTLAPEDYHALALAYATSTARSGGISAERAFVLAEDVDEDHRKAYVKLSRARERAEVFAHAGDPARVEHIARLAREAHEQHLRALPPSAGRLDLEQWARQAEAHRQHLLRQQEEQRRQQEERQRQQNDHQPRI